MITEEKIYIGDIPCLKIEGHEKVKGVIIFYHGWSSTKELQSLRGHILAAYGYDVLIPEAIYHGERGLIDYDENPRAYKRFSVIWKRPASLLTMPRLGSLTYRWLLWDIP